jgi:hypothetical protein
MSRRLPAATALALGSVLAAAVGVAAPASAASGGAVPVHDPNIDGTLTFCNEAGQPVTSGSLTATPFAWKTLSSSPAPEVYRSDTGRATLLAYQPLKFVDPGDWSGSQLTGSSTFTNPDHPVAATGSDSPLLNFVQAYPPHWKGLVELRMIFTGVNLPNHITPYPAAVVRVGHGRWTMVSGGGTSCSDGNGVSDETKLLPPKKLRSHPVVLAGSPTPKPTSSRTSSHSSSSGSGPGASIAADHSDPPSTTNTADSSSVGAGTKAGIGLGVLALLGLIAGGVAWRRRSSVSSR